jgi:hypothetical protein
METANILTLNFRRLTHNPFFRAKLLDKFEGKCNKCSKKLSPDDNSWSVHHLTYEHSCIYLDLVEIEVRQIRHGKERLSKRHVTQCEHCFTVSNRAFLECQKRTIPLCSRCHFQVHKIDIAEYKKEKAKGKDLDKRLIRIRVNARYKDEDG